MNKIVSGAIALFQDHHARGADLAEALARMAPAEAALALAALPPTKSGHCTRPAGIYRPRAGAGEDAR